jgi:hypothetical protein
MRLDTSSFKAFTGRTILLGRTTKSRLLFVPCREVFSGVPAESSVVLVIAYAVTARQSKTEIL